MTFDPNDVLRRFHRALVREIQANSPEHLSAPFSVAEIYQNLVPYRTHRDEIGVEMNADYEHALLRLLAGDGDFLTIESRTARQEIREELESPNPNTGLYRDFAAADVRLNPEKIDEALMGDPGTGGGAPGAGESESAGVPGAEDPTPEPAEGDPSFVGGEEGEKGASSTDGTEEMADLTAQEDPTEEGIEEETVSFPEEGSQVEAVVEVDPEEVLVELSGEETPADNKVDDDMTDKPTSEGADQVQGEGFPPAACAWCREALPQRTGVNFCPFCGCSVHLVPCPECGEELELNWRFCIACGTEVSS